MDQTLKLKLRDFERALEHLRFALEEKPDEKDMVRDAVVQRFEYTFEICFKTTKLFLSQQYGISENSPKSCFRSLLVTKLLEEDDIETLLRLIDDRNLTVHTYDENFIVDLRSRTDSYYQIMKKVYEAVQNTLNK